MTRFTKKSYKKEQRNSEKEAVKKKSAERSVGRSSSPCHAAAGCMYSGTANFRQWQSPTKSHQQVCPWMKYIQLYYCRKKGICKIQSEIKK
jgi:hypothetical protein